MYDLKEGTFEIAVSYDGFKDRTVKKFRNEIEFVNWLSKQSDFSLGGFDQNEKDLYEESAYFRGNQRITRQDLEEYLK